MCQSFRWHSEADMLSAAADLRIHCWYYPSAIYVDSDLMDLCKMMKEVPEIGRECMVEDFNQNTIFIKKKNGSQLNYNISAYPRMLLDFCRDGEWPKAIKLCRYLSEPSLWALLGSISLKNNNNETAEIALAKIDAIDKVQYIAKISESKGIAQKVGFMLYFKKYGKYF